MLSLGGSTSPGCSIKSKPCWKEAYQAPYKPKHITRYLSICSKFCFLKEPLLSFSFVCFTSHCKLETEGLDTGFVLHMGDERTVEALLNIGSKNSTALMAVSLWQQMNLLQGFIPSSLQVHLTQFKLICRILPLNEKWERWLCLSSTQPTIFAYLWSIACQSFAHWAVRPTSQARTICKAVCQHITMITIALTFFTLLCSQIKTIIFVACM